MDCRETQHKIDRYLRGELPGDAADEVEAHIDACPDCRRALDNARKLETVFRRASTPPAPDEFASDLRERAAERGQQSAPDGDTVLGPLPAWRTLSTPWRAAVAASLVVGLALGIILGSGPASSRRTEAARAAQTPGLDYLSDSPRGSINHAFVSMISRSQKQE